jgi:phosphatidylinositol alpha 1,6-mannosyltransferase
VLAAAAGGPLDLILDGVSGLLRPAEVGAFADALVALAASPARRSLLGRNGQAAANTRTWERSLERLGAGYARALGGVGVRASGEAQREEVQHVGL